MKKITLFLFMLVAFIGFGQNLITNGDFQSNTGIPIDNWSGFNNQSLSDDITSSNVGNINNAEGSLFQEFTAVGSTTYQVTFDYRWVSGSGNYNMTVRFRERPSNTNLTLSNANGGSLNGTSDGFTVNTTPDTWYNASFRVTVASGSTIRLLFYKGNGNRPFRLDNVSVRKLATFDGSTDSDWATSANWDTNELPTDDDVIIPSGQNVIISSTTGAEVGNITIDSSGSLTINGGGSLDVNGTPNGNITYNRTLVANKWHLVGSPVVGETYDNTWVSANGIASGTGNNRGVSWYDNSSSDPTTGHWRYLQDGNSGNFESSSGYGLISTAGGTVSFTGTYPTGAKPATVSNANTNKFNLVSNPYPTYLAVSEFFTDNASSKFTENTIWIWDQSGNMYVPKTSDSDGTFEIAPGQAFFISSGDGTNVQFYQFNGSSASDTFLKNNRTEVSISVNDGTTNKTTNLHYIESATNNFDNGYDASLFTGVSTDFSIFTGLLSNSQKSLSRQVVSIGTIETTVIPVGIKAEANKEISFSAKPMNLPTGTKVFLEDRQENVFTDLSNDNKYTLNLTENLEGTGRFFIHTTSAALSTNDVDLQNVNMYQVNNSSLKIMGLPQGKASIKIFNILGKQMMNQNFKASGSNEITLPRLARGVYLVQLEATEGKLNKKIIIE